MSCDHEHAGLRSSVLPALFCTVPSPQHARPIQACSKTARQHHGTLVWQRWAERLEHNSGSEVQSTNCLLLLEAGMPYSCAEPAACADFLSVKSRQRLAFSSADPLLQYL